MVLLRVTALHVSPNVRSDRLTCCGHAEGKFIVSKRGLQDNALDVLLTDEAKVDCHFCEVLDGHGAVVLMNTKGVCQGELGE